MNMVRQPDKPEFRLSARLEALLASLSTYYAKKKETLLQRIVVNARHGVEEGWDFDNWDGGMWGHLVHLQVPSSLFFEALDSKTEVEDDLAKDLNKLESIPGEYVAKVSVELIGDPADGLWRERSGVLASNTTLPMVPEKRSSHLWRPGFLRVFLSHTSKYKKETAQVRDSLAYLGASAFVAHEDIRPTKEWQDEIELALFSMNVMVPLLTEGYKESKWTDQEIGVAVGRGILVVPVRLGLDPYGFIGKYQAVSGRFTGSGKLARDLFEIFLSHPETERQAIQALVRRFEEAESFNQANDLMDWLEKIRTASADVVMRLESASGKNRQVGGAFRVRERLPVLLRRLNKRAAK